MPDLEVLTSKIISGDLDYTQAIEVESKADDLVDWAPNVLAWCADKRFLGMKPYAKQAEILLHLFEDYCVHCSDVSYLADIPTQDTVEQVMARVALLNFGVCPHCNFDRSVGRASNVFNDPLELIAVIGQRAGKCVVGETEFFDGRKRRVVEEAVDQNFEVVSKTADNKLKYCKATAFAQGEKDCIRLTLKDGSSVTLSTDHRVFTPRGWVPAGQLTTSDLVGTPRFIPQAKGEIHVSDDEVTRMAEAALSSTERLPEEFWGLSDRQVSLFIKVLLSHSTDATSITFRSEGMADDVRFLLARSGIRSLKRRDHSWALLITENQNLIDNELIWEAVDRIDPVGKKKVYDLSVPETECFVGNNIVLHNSALTAMAISYLIHKNLYLTSPWKVYGLTPGQVIDFTVVATTVGQSEKTLWSAFRGMFTQSHWFKAYKAACDEEGKRHGVKEAIKVGETFLFFDHKGILVYFAANNPSSLRGTTRFGAAIDELGWFGEAEPGSQKVRSNGPETYSALNNACLTLRTAVDSAIKKNPKVNLPIPIMFNISSPRAMNDPIMSVYRERAGDRRVIRRHWATWEVNPNLSREALARELATSNGVRDFAAQPPITDDPLVPKMHIVTDCFKSPLATDQKYGPIIIPSVTGFVDELDVPSGRTSASYLTGKLQDTAVTPRYDVLRDLSLTDPEAWEALGPLKDTFKDLIAKPASRRPHIMGVDLGTKNNALAVVCGYLAASNSKFITDFALEIKPQGARSVNIADVFDRLITPLVERLNVVAVFYDTWQSVHQIQSLSQKFGSLGPLNSPSERRRWLKDLRDKKKKPDFVADQYSLTMADALMLVSRMEQGDLLFPALEIGVMEMLVNRAIDPAGYPYSQLALQISTVRARGPRLLKPVGSDDDLFRAWANAAVKALTDDMVIDLLSQDSKVQDLGMPAQTKTSHVSLGSAGKGLRRTDVLQTNTLSRVTATTPVIVKHSGRGRN